MTSCLVGSSGRLGTSLKQCLGDAITSLPPSVYRGWVVPDATRAISQFFENMTCRPSTIYIASGLLSPATTAEELRGVNFVLPRNIIEATEDLGIRVVTFGTVMESLEGVSNNYILSKRSLADYVSDSAAGGRDVLHLRIHTLYGGGPPSPFMFLGQMLAALREGCAFKMTSGTQLREYHHVEDEARAIVALNDGGTKGVRTLSHGSPTTLRELAIAVFQAAGMPALLQLGALPDPEAENYQERFPATTLPGNVSFRNPLRGVVEHMLQFAPFDCAAAN